MKEPRGKRKSVKKGTWRPLGLPENTRRKKGVGKNLIAKKKHLFAIGGR